MQRGLEHTHPLLPEHLRDSSAWEHGVEGVERAGHHVQLTQHAAVLQALRERNVFIVEEVERPHANPCRRKACKVLSPKPRPAYADVPANPAPGPGTQTTPRR
ncbi:hypothetical protein EMGBD1_15340 [Anaerolineaceae bacterium]|nr:hypothetical protein EMGBD1_15340 [Anaerolineaceae bacterium]